MILLGYLENLALLEIGENNFKLMDSLWMKSVFVGAALFAIIVVSRCAVTLIKRRFK